MQLQYVLFGNESPTIVSFFVFRPCLHAVVLPVPWFLVCLILAVTRITFIAILHCLPLQTDTDNKMVKPRPTNAEKAQAAKDARLAKEKARREENLAKGVALAARNLARHAKTAQKKRKRKLG